MFLFQLSTLAEGGYIAEEYDTPSDILFFIFQKQKFKKKNTINTCQVTSRPGEKDVHFVYCIHCHINTG
jgi:hypothetical protein